MLALSLGIVMLIIAIVLSYSYYALSPHDITTTLQAPGPSSTYAKLCTNALNVYGC